MILYTLDACALLSYFKRSERGHVYMVDFLKSHGSECAVHAMNMAEVYYITLRQLDLARADEAYRAVLCMGIVIGESVSEGLWKDAAWLKETYQLGFMDAMALAFARANKATMVSSDGTAFQGLKKGGIAKIQLF